MPAILKRGGQTRSGTLYWWNASKGFGFIRTAPLLGELGSLDVFVSITSFVSESTASTVEAGAALLFNIIESAKGLTATDVVLA
jgi:cold shock CspA family protein